MMYKKGYFLFLRSKSVFLLFILIGACIGVSAQQNSDQNTPAERRPNVRPADEQKDDNRDSEKTKDSANSKLGVTAEQIAETSIVLYGTRERLNQVRKTTYERGVLSIVNDDGKTEKANYERWIMRGEDLEKERIRFEKEFPNAKFALINNGGKIFGIFNDAVFIPREDAAKEFENRTWHGLEALLRYKENGSQLELVGREKILGVDLYVVDLTDKKGRKTRFYVSAKTFRIMMLEYTEDNIKYKRKFYDYNYAQGTLVPYRTVLWADGKKIEEMDVQIISFGQKVEDYLFEEG